MCVCGSVNFDKNSQFSFSRLKKVCDFKSHFSHLVLFYSSLSQMMSYILVIILFNALVSVLIVLVMFKLFFGDFAQNGLFFILHKLDNVDLK